MTKKYLIMERMGVPLKKIEENLNDGTLAHIYEGPCANFKRNRNERIYDRDDYNNHLTYLREAISKKALLGELDHPEGYSVSMKNVSHRVEDLWYDEATDTVMIRIKLLATTAGKDAMAIAEAGSPIHVSSRAAGMIDEEGQVTLDRIYTYDIVSEPGFKEAELTAVNEVFGTTKNLGGRVAIMEMNNNGTNGTIKEEGPKAGLNNQKPIREMRRKSKLTGAKNPSRRPTGRRRLDESASTLTEVIKHQNEIVQQLTELRRELNAQSRKSEQIVGYLGEVRKVVNENDTQASKTRKLVERRGKQNDQIVNKVNEMIDELSKNIMITEKLIRYSNAQTKQVNKLAEHNNHIATVTNENLGELETKIGKIIEYSNHTSGYVNKLVENLGLTKRSSRRMVEGSHNRSRSKNRTTTAVNENANPSVRRGRTKPATEKRIDISESIKGIKKRSTERRKQVLENNYPFIKNVNQAVRQIFENLEEKDRGKVKRLLSDHQGRITTKVVESTINKVDRGIVPFNVTDTIPGDLVKVWESLSTARKHSIIGLSSHRNMTNQSVASAFWRSVLEDYRPRTARLADTSFGVPTDVSESVGTGNQLGYSVAAIDAMFENL